MEARVVADTILCSRLLARRTLISPEMTILLVHSPNLQIAGPAEHYWDFGDIPKPKFDGAWHILGVLRITCICSKGFRAPNLAQVDDHKRTFRTSQMSRGRVKTC